jgi:PKD repeat protein
MAFDTHRGVTVLFGGYSSVGSRLNDTWEYNGAWQNVTTPQTPSGRYHHAMAFDTRRNVTVAFGGLDSSNSILGDTWEYDGTTWHSITPSQSPSPRHNHSMTYDTARGVVVLFGGLDSSGALNDTWEYDGTTWKQVTTSQSPSPRTEMSLAYDNQRGKVMLFGGGYWGGGGLTVFTQTWEYTATVTLPPPSVFDRKVYVIVYDPVLSNTQNLSTYLHWNAHAALTQGAVGFFKQVSNNGMNYTIAYTTVVTAGWPEKVDGYRYTEAEYLAVINGQSPPHSPDGVDYNKIVNSLQFDICGKLNRGEIDEVWIYNGPYFGFYESTLVGPGAYWYNSPPVPGPYSCDKLLPIMGPSPERGLAEMIEDFGHRTESTMTQVYGSWQQNRTAHNWERFALVKALSPNYSYSGCGNVHYPPNGTSDYDYGNTSTVLSNCEDFANYPNLSEPLTVAQPVTCSAWNCSHLDYFNYWFSHLPSNAGCAPDSFADDWWYYFASPALALNPSSPCSQVPPLAGFTASPTSGVRPLSVTFADISTGAVSSWGWTFGDGGTSIQQNPIYTYTSPGVYTVSLTISGLGGSATLTRTNLITVTEPPPVANFLVSPTSGLKPLTVVFTDTSSGLITNWLWKFGDGLTSTQHNPIHVYTSTGTFTAALHVSGPGGASAITGTNVITVFEPVSAAFQASPTSGHRPLTVTFANQSTGDYASSLWSFGDGSIGTNTSPTHIYTSSGVYTVSLRIRGSGGTDTVTRTNSITVTEPPPVAAFTAMPLTGQIPLTVHFADQSTGLVTNWFWQFGDGLTSTLPGPRHTYILTGSFGVTLTVVGPGGANMLFKDKLITVTNLFTVYLPVVMRNPR